MANSSFAVHHSSPSGLLIRRATGRDAERIVAILRKISSERVHSAIDEPWSVDEERSYLESLSPREAVHVAVAENGQVIGFQTLDRWSPTLNSMAHVAQLGTFLLPEWRGRGVGTALYKTALAFARASDYSKIVIQVRASNQSAQAFYERLGFRPCGRLKQQVRIDGQEDDEILMEFFL